MSTSESERERIWNEGYRAGCAMTAGEKGSGRPFKETNDLARLRRIVKDEAITTDDDVRLLRRLVALLEMVRP